MSVEEKIKEVAQIKGVTLKNLAIKIEMTETGFYAMIRNKSMKVETLQKISKVLGIDPAVLLNQAPLSDTDLAPRSAEFYSGSNIRVLPIVVDKEEIERITFVPIKAAAGYLTRFQDLEYIQQLPSFNLPNLKDGTYRAFEVEGDSMKPTIHAGDIVICRYVENWFHIMDNRIYLVAGVEGIGIVVKRVINRLKKDNKVILCSENDFYPNFELPAEEIYEVWEVKVKVSTNLEPPLYLDNRLRRLEENINNVVGMVSKVLVTEKG
ncbi:helix-turn-helix domain-containing protein [Rhodocytophaga rosea]|uniref:Helix-turn-helix domain-containing protein n=1 Tax=Rhodocytophaga rosea TaxID=2704465 RepID=A0A6C0GG89_9BACT|nr:S24 family peptidase [Rhodocytophaga rosea]QHT67026.1 helix-turn-helix domain-containing protein [Rhodocytophaga rosea]